MAICEATFYTAFRSPSIKTLVSRLEIDQDKAKQIKDVLTGKIDLMSFQSARKRQQEAYHPHNPQTLALEVLNELLDGHGVSYIRSKTDGCYDAEGLDYVNMGDTYYATLVYDCRSRCWYACSWGDIVETDSDRFGE